MLQADWTTRKTLTTHTANTSLTSYFNSITPARLYRTNTGESQDVGRHTLSLILLGEQIFKHSRFPDEAVMFTENTPVKQKPRLSFSCFPSSTTCFVTLLTSRIQAHITSIYLLNINRIRYVRRWRR